jgi:hypothetical protein
MSKEDSANCIKNNIDSGTPVEGRGWSVRECPNTEIGCAALWLAVNNEDSDTNTLLFAGNCKADQNAQQAQAKDAFDNRPPHDRWPTN